MKLRHILSIFLIGVLLMIVGSLFKILHWYGAPQLIIAATFVKAVALILGIWKLLTSDKYRDFLDS